MRTTTHNGGSLAHAAAPSVGASVLLTPFAAGPVVEQLRRGRRDFASARNTARRRKVLLDEIAMCRRVIAFTESTLERAREQLAFQEHALAALPAPILRVALLPADGGSRHG